MFFMGARWAKCFRPARDEALQTQLGMIKTVVEEIEGLERRFCGVSKPDFPLQRRPFLAPLA